MPSVKLHFLGPPRIERGNQILAVDTRKATALLAYLALTGERPSRDWRAAFLWPEFDDARAKAALRRTLSALKAAVGGEALHATREIIGLEGEAVWCDAVAFQQSVGAGDLETAVSLYRDDFMSGFSLRDAMPFDDWQLQQAEHLRRELDGVLARLVQKAADHHDFAGGILLAHRWLQLDTLREEAHCQLMRLYAWNNQRTAAMRQYRECVQVLEEELGVAPLAETTALYEQIQANLLPAPALVAPQGPAPSAEMPEKTTPPISAVPLVGREAARAAMQEIYAQVGPNGRFLVISGETGICKTSLVEHFLSQLGDAPCLPLRCYEEASGLAYAPFVEALRQRLQQPEAAAWLDMVPAVWLAETTRLLPEIEKQLPTMPALPPFDWPGAPGRFIEGLSQVIEALLTGPKPGVLWVDDMQWIDSASLGLLASLLHRWQERPFLMLACWRADELSENEQITALLHQARRDNMGYTLTLPRLNQTEVTQLLATHSVVSPHAPETAERLFRETEGLPFLLAAYLRAWPAAAQQAGSWVLPVSAQDLFHQRLERAGEKGLQLLQTAAVIGRAFDFDLLLAASGRSEDEALPAFEALLGRHLLLELEGPLPYDFTHHKLREITYQGMSLVRKRLLHRRVAQALQKVSRGQPAALAGQIAFHYQRAGQDEEAALFYRQAGDHSRALFAHREALNQYQTALALGHPETAVLHEACGDLQTRLGEYKAALHSYERAAAGSAESELPRLEHKIGQIYHRRGEWPLAEHHFAQAEGGLSSGEAGADVARLYGDWSLAAYRAGSLAKAIHLAEKAQALAAATPTEAQTANILGILARSQSQIPAAIAYFERSAALAETHQLLGVHIAALNNLALTETAVGHLDHAQALYETALQKCLFYGDRHWEAALRNNLADLAHQRGQEEAAMTQLKQAVTIYAEIGQEAGTWQPEIWKLSEW